MPTYSQFKCNVYRNRSNQIISTIQLPQLNRKEEICLNRLRVDLLLRHQLYRHNFDNINPNCNFCQTPLTTNHFLFQCKYNPHKLQINSLLASLDDIYPDLFGILLIKYTTVSKKSNFLLYGATDLNFGINCSIIHNTAKFIRLFQNTL